MIKIATYSIQQWLFDEAEGKFSIDLGESGIQFHHFHDLDLTENYDLNYSLDRGKLLLREQISNMYGVDKNNVVITNGAQEGLYLFYRSFLKSDDHVIVFSPGWQQSWEVPKTIGVQVSCINLKAKDYYRIDFNTLNKHINENTKLIILTNPCNPTGVSLSEEEWNKLEIICKNNNIFLLCDEEYYTQYATSAIHRVKNSAIVSSLSKVYGFPGLRLGWFISQPKIVEQVINYKRYVTVTNSSLCESLSMQVLLNYQKYHISYKKIITEGYVLLQEWLTKEKHFELNRSEGTPFVYLTLPNEINSFEFCKLLLKEQQTLVMPAEVFNDQNAIRISIGRPINILLTGLEKISSCFKKNYVFYG